MALMPGPWWHTGMDALSAMLTPDEAKRAICGVDRFVSALHRFVADLARHGHDVIYETGLLEQAWIDDFWRAAEGLPVFPVEFDLGLDEVRRREAGRPDRPDGYSEGSYGRLIRLPNALRTDAAALGPDDRALAIKEFVESSR